MSIPSNRTRPSFQILTFNVQYNNPQKNIFIFNYGLSSEAKTLTLYDHKERNIGGSTFEVQSIRNTNTPYRFECALKALDGEQDICKQTVGLLKIDTEGHELSVLEGAKEFISKQKPVIMMEDWASRGGKESKSIKFLRDLGYKHFLVPASTPSKQPSRDKIESLINHGKFLMQLLLNGQEEGPRECDFSAPRGYDLIIAHT